MLYVDKSLPHSDVVLNCNVVSRFVIECKLDDMFQNGLSLSTSSTLDLSGKVSQNEVSHSFQ